MIYTHVLNRGGHGVVSPLDEFDFGAAGSGGIVTCFICWHVGRIGVSLSDLFSQNTVNRNAPLAEQLRPQTPDDVIGQQHLLGRVSL